MTIRTDTPGREVVSSSLHRHPSVGPVYLDDGSMVPKSLLDGLVEVREEECLSDIATKATYRYYVKE